MSRRVLAVAIAASLLGGAIFVPPATAVVLPLSQPNIVVFYLDDTNPTDGRLWSDPALTPNLYDLFVAHGIHVENAFGETPLCCPSRASLLTGLHTHNHGVVRNDARLFNPAENVGKALGRAGYQSMLIGKFMNLPNLMTSQQWQAAADGWSQFDAFSSPSDGFYKYFYDYTMFTRQGTLTFGEAPAEHSTRVIADRAVMRLQQADPSKPVFQLLSMFDTHFPNLAMPGFEQDPRVARCSSMPPWKPPNYNEADVSDKPPYIQQQPLLPYSTGWPMDAYCREMLGVDWLVGRVVEQLKLDGRFDNTMFMFAADNGMAWGQHRLGNEKQSPYATRIPLYFSWPARWGTEPRTISEYVSDIDFAPTFCEVGGCTLGPYPGGQTKPDGVSLLGLLDGTVSNLGRDALLEDSFETRDWAGVRTTPGNPLGLWHYVFYPSGFVELYNDATDPWEMRNLARLGYSKIKAALRQRLFELLAEGRPNNPATLTVIEDSVPEANQDFTYSGSFGTFALDDDADPTLPSSRVFSNLEPGTYTLTQAKWPGWTLKSLTCEFPTEINVATGTATLHLLPNDNITCTFRNLRRGPDASIAAYAAGPYKGVNVYALKPIRKQTLRRRHVAAGLEYDYFINVHNRGSETDSFMIGAAVNNGVNMTSAFSVDGIDATTAIVTGTFDTGPLEPGASKSVVLKVFVSPTSIVGDRSVVVVRALSDLDHTAVDVVRAVTVR